MRARSFAELVSAVYFSPFFIVSAAVLVPCPERWPPELGMFPELNNLLSTAPDKAEQVISRAVERGGPGSVAEERVRDDVRRLAGRTRCP